MPEYYYEYCSRFTKHSVILQVIGMYNNFSPSEHFQKIPTIKLTSWFDLAVRTWLLSFGFLLSWVLCKTADTLVYLYQWQYAWGTLIHKSVGIHKTALCFEVSCHIPSLSPEINFPHFHRFLKLKIIPGVIPKFTLFMFVFISTCNTDFHWQSSEWRVPLPLN